MHLINAGGEHNNPNVLVYDTVAPAENIEINLQLEQQPKSITLQPGNRKIPLHIRRAEQTSAYQR